LPLEPFDDTEYDCRLPEEWIEYGNDPITGAFCPIPGKGLWRDGLGSGFWRAVLINSYEAERNVFCGVWDDEDREYCELTRINLLFNAEDPRIFAQRVAQAHQERIFADS
jgi:dynein heavy chain